MSAPHFHRNHAQHISKSEKLSEELKKTGQNILSQIDHLNPKVSDQLLIKVINGIVGGILVVIPDLQEVVIKSSRDKENNSDLKDMLKKLSQYCNEMVQDYDSDSSTLKTKFQTFIKNIVSDSESLLNIIKRDNLHDFKHELVESLKEILCTIHLGQIRIQIDGCNEEELKKLAEKARKEFSDDISILEKCGLDVLKTVAINVKFNAKQALKMAYHYNKVASNFDDIDIQHKILNAANFLNSETSTALQMNEKLTDIDTKEALNILQQWNIQGWNTINELFAFNDNHDNSKKSQNLRDIVKLAVAYGFLITNNLGSYVNHDGLFARLY